MEYGKNLIHATRYRKIDWNGGTSVAVLVVQDILHNSYFNFPVSNWNFASLEVVPRP